MDCRIVDSKVMVRDDSIVAVFLTTLVATNDLW